MIKVNLLVIFIAAVGNVFNCGLTKSKSAIRGIIITAKNQVNYRDSTYEIDNLLEIYYFEDLVMFKYPYLYDSVINGKTILHEYRNAFFVFQKDSVYGYHYDASPYKTMPDNKRFPVDSVHEKRQNSNYDLIFNWKPDSVVLDSANKVIREVYYYPTKNADSIYYTNTLYYSSKMVNIPESFSKKLDSSRNSKLFKIVISNNGQIDKFNQSRILIVEEMKENNVVDDDNVIFYFKKYKDQVINKKHVQ